MLFLQQFNKIAVMDTIQIKDKRFTPFIPEERILKEVARVASEINRDLEGTNPLFLSVLNGAFMFAADLMRNLTIPSEISFVKLASYTWTVSNPTPERRQARADKMDAPAMP
jgi:hypoxanthine phosphoribosyltransferase